MTHPIAADIENGMPIAYVKAFNTHLRKAPIATKADRRSISRAFARRSRWDEDNASVAPIHCIISDRGRMADKLMRMGNPAKVALVIDRMDCDCARWTSVCEIEASVGEIARAMADVYANAEGPVFSMFFTSIEEGNEYRGLPSRDLALEAFEDGHPHVIHA